MFENLFQKYATPRNILFLTGIILFVVFIFNIPEIALMFFASFVIACSLEPLVKKLIPKFGRKMACSIVLLGAILFICAFFVPIIVIGTHEIKAFAVSFPEYVDNIKTFITDSNIINRTDIANLDIGGVISSVSGTTSQIIAEILNAGKNIGSAFVYLIVSILLIYYFMLDREKIKASVLKLFPKDMRKRTGEIVDAIAERSGGYVIAQIVTMASVGVIITIGLFILRNEYALLLGLMSALFDIVPVVGPAIAFVICMIAVYKSGPLVLILTAVLFGAAQLAENNFVRPYVFSKFLDLHPLIIYLFLFIAAKYMGIVGVIFAPAIAATVVVLIEEVYMKNME